MIKQLNELSDVILALKNGATYESFGNLFNQAIDIVSNTINSGGIVFTCGNGGSMADALHLTAEIVGTYKDKTRRGLSSLTLGCNPSSYSSISNDIGADVIFSRELQGFQNPDRQDCLIGFSTSGNSKNIVEAVLATSMPVIIFSGGNEDCNLAGICNANPNMIFLGVPSLDTPRIQEIHTFLIHCLMDEVEARLI